MDVKSRKTAEHQKVDIAAPEAAAPKKSEGSSGEKSARAVKPDDAHDGTTRGFKQLSGEFKSVAQPPSAELESLWPGGGESESKRSRKGRGGGNEVAHERVWSHEARSRGHGRRDIDHVKHDLDKTQDDIDKAATRLERMWRRADRKFREQVLKELEKHGNIPAEVKAKIADEVSKLHRLERQIENTRDPEKKAALEAQYKALSDELATTLAENGVELELLLAVERAAGEDGQDGSLSGLIKSYYELAAELQYLNSMQTTHEVAMQQIAEAQQRRAAEVKHDLKVLAAKRAENVVERIHAELANRIPVELRTATVRADI